MMESIIIYFGQKAKVDCDGKCYKAWGRNSRPRIQLSNDEDEDDFVFVADDEFGEAPANPGTYEGGYGKPYASKEFPNKWCVRECERCSISKPGEWDKPLAIKDFSIRT